jgi:hypothetical protein
MTTSQRAAVLPFVEEALARINDLPAAFGVEQRAELVEIYRRMESGEPLPPETEREIIDIRVRDVYGKKPDGHAPVVGSIPLPNAMLRVAQDWRASSGMTADRLHESGMATEAGAIRDTLAGLPTDAAELEDSLDQELHAAGHVRTILEAFLVDGGGKQRRVRNGGSSTRKRRHNRKGDPKRLTAKQSEALTAYAELNGDIPKAAKRCGISPKSLRDRLEGAWLKIGKRPVMNVAKVNTKRLPTDKRGQEIVLSKE